MTSLIQIFSVSWIMALVFIQLLGMLGLILAKKSARRGKEPDVSFVVAVWNEGERAARCVHSILMQEYPSEKFKVILIGGGDEKTVRICNELARNGRVTFIHEKKRMGKWFALNTALKRVKTDYVAFTDADCILERRWLRKMLSSDADIVISEFCSTSEKSVQGKLYNYGLHFTSRISEGIGLLFGSGEYMGIGSVVKSKVFKKVKFKDNFNEDWVFVNDARKRGFAVGHADAKTYQHMPSSINDYRKGLSTRMKGFITAVKPGGDYLSAAILIVSLLIAVSMPFYVYYMFNLDGFAVVMLFLLMLSTALFSLVSSLRHKNHRSILYTPFIIPMALIFGFVAVETAYKMVMRKEIKWEIYNKKEE